MPGPLEDAREEQLCHLLAAGMPADTAYWKSGFKKDKSNASKKCREPHITARVGELREEAAKLGIFGTDAQIEALADAAMTGASSDEAWGIAALKDWVRAAKKAGNVTAGVTATVKLIEEAHRERNRSEEDTKSDTDLLLTFRPMMQQLAKAWGLKWSLAVADAGYHALLIPGGFARHDVKATEERALRGGQA